MIGETILGDVLSVRKQSNDGVCGKVTRHLT